MLNPSDDQFADLTARLCNQHLAYPQLRVIISQG